MKQFIKPEFKLEFEDLSKNFGRFLVEPLERGFGVTLGNAIRRTLISTTPGAAVFAVRIKGAKHEFVALPGVVEDVTAIILNIKKLVIKISEDIILDGESVILKVSKDEPGPVYARDIECPTGVTILNEDLVLANIAEGGSLEIELFARNSRGYRSFQDNKKEKKYADLIVIDCNYSPIERVSYRAEPTKVGKNANLEKLEIEVQTKGSITPSDAIAIAARILTAHLEFFINLNESIQDMKVISTEANKEKDELNHSIDTLELTHRSRNCLKRADIDTIGQLISWSEEEVQNIKHLGKKSFQEIKNKVLQLGLQFRKD